MELRLAQFLSSQSWLFVLVIFYAITITYGREADFVCECGVFATDYDHSKLTSSKLHEVEPLVFRACPGTPKAHTTCLNGYDFEIPKKVTTPSCYNGCTPEMTRLCEEHCYEQGYELEGIFTDLREADPETGDALIREFCSKVTKEGLKATSPGLLWATHSRMKACGERVYSEYPVWVTMYQVICCKEDGTPDKECIDADLEGF